MIPVGDFVGLPYRDLGRDRDGVDCYGLVRLVMRDLRGIALPSLVDGYAGGGDVPGVAETVRTHLPRDWVRIDRAEPYALVMFRGRPAHVGVCVGEGRFLHADRPIPTSRIDRLDDPRYASRIEGYYRHAG